MVWEEKLKQAPCGKIFQVKSIKYEKTGTWVFPCGCKTSRFTDLLVVCRDKDPKPKTQEIVDFVKNYKDSKPKEEKQ